MTGPEHYKAAEDALAVVKGGAVDWQAPAQVAIAHALLALAAATALPAGSDGDVAIDPIVTEWWQVAT